MSSNEKNIPKRRFKEFLKGEAWEERKIGDIADIVRGASPRPIQDPKWFDNENSEIGWLRISDVTEQNGRIHFLEQRISKEGQDKTRVLLEPHLLLSIAATVGKPVINYVKTGVHDGFLIFLNPKFDREYMFQWLEMFRPQWQQFGQPGSQVNLNSEIVRNAEICIPTFREQQEIGNFFTNLDNLITLHQRKLDKLKVLKKAYLAQMFPSVGESKPRLRFSGFNDDWEQRKLCEIADRFDNLRVPVAADLRKEGLTPYYGANGIQDYVEGFTHDGEFILVAEDGANDLKNYPVNYVNGRIWVNNHAHVLQGKDKITDTRFLGYSINRANIASLLVGGGRAKLNSDIMMNIQLQLPSVEEQKLISEYFSSIDNLITLHQRKLEKLQNIKKAYLSEMFV